jgi:hypothetical protein
MGKEKRDLATKAVENADCRRLRPAISPAFGKLELNANKLNRHPEPFDAACGVAHDRIVPGSNSPPRNPADVARWMPEQVRHDGQS